MKVNTQVLGQFRPSVLSEETIRLELTTWLEARGIKPMALPWGDHRHPLQVRGPEENKRNAEQSSSLFGPVRGYSHGFVSHWHRDANNQAEYFIVWSNAEQTEIQWRKVPFAPFDVVLIHGRAIHRTPAWRASARWFARTYGPIRKEKS